MTKPNHWYARLALALAIALFSLTPLSGAHNTAGLRPADLHSGVGGVYVASPGYVEGGGVIPGGFNARTGGVCDLEVLSDGDGSTPDDNFLDETVVDSNDDTGGEVPDGTWDDGGFGAACHTSRYPDSAYNSRGCAGASYADDVISGGEIWIATTCDFMGASPNPVTSFAVCLLLAHIETAIPDAEECANQFVNCVGEPHCDPVLPVCGPDGKADAISYGRGGDGVAYPSIQGCPQIDSVAATFVLNTVVEDSQTVAPAFTGWIDWG